MTAISLKTLYRLAALTWACVGMMLFCVGLRLIFSNEALSIHFSLVSFFSSMLGTRDGAIFLLLVGGLFVGYFKGNYVLKKTVSRQARRLSAIDRPLNIFDLYTKKYLVLISLMISLGFLLRALPIHPDVRGVIDVAVGAALLFGASNYMARIRTDRI